LKTLLSIVLPVYNAQARLMERVERALELAGELTPRFELLVCDDASTDQTEEIAAELAHRYPQVRLVRSDRRLGKSRTIQAAMQRAEGEVVLIVDPAAPLSAAQLRRLWELREDPRLVMAQAEQPQPKTLSASLLQRLAAWGESLARSANRSAHRGGVQMIRRQGLIDLAGIESPERELVLERVDGAEYVLRGGLAVARPSLLSRLKGFPAAE
jgi:cellulose synthase/poly-beta-1,6-N-acetylglucosamine synthase-like glycosyltransferase